MRSMEDFGAALSGLFGDDDEFEDGSGGPAVSAPGISGTSMAAVSAAAVTAALTSPLSLRPLLHSLRTVSLPPCGRQSPSLHSPSYLPLSVFPPVLSPHDFRGLFFSVDLCGIV